MGRGLKRLNRGAAFVGLAAVLGGCPLFDLHVPATEDIAQEWMSLTLDALEQDGRMPTVEARTLWHVSATMYEAWAAYDPVATGYFTGDDYDRSSASSLKNRAETLSHAVFLVLTHRFASLGDAASGTPARDAFDAFAAKMRLHGYIDGAGNPRASEAQALGEILGEAVLAFAATDGANEANGYADTSGYTPTNPPLIVDHAGTNGMLLANDWQPLMVDGVEQTYLTPHWGVVKPFALPDYDPQALRIDPGAPPHFGEGTQAQFIEDMMDCLWYVGAMDPDVGAGGDLVNLSPSARGAFVDGTYDGTGHPVNPYTGEPYPDHFVSTADFLRVESVYLDGHRFTTPAPWWNEVALDVLRGEGTVSEPPANRHTPYDLEYDVKLFFTLNGALHDAAIAVWEIKREYNYLRPISGIRYLAQLGMLPLEPGLVEIVDEGDPLAGAANEHVGEQKVLCWTGPDEGVQWVLGETWIPYQPVGFVTPPFPGYCSGHTAFGRAFAAVMSAFTEDSYFPGGLFQLPVTTLRFETDMTTTVVLQAATYHDLGYDAGLARIMSGVHVPADIWASQQVGQLVGASAFAQAHLYFGGQESK